MLIETWVFVIAILVMGIVALVVLSIHEHGSVGKHLKEMRQKELRAIERGQKSFKDKDFAKQEWVHDKKNSTLVLKDLENRVAEYNEKRDKPAWRTDNAFSENVKDLADKEFK